MASAPAMDCIISDDANVSAKDTPATARLPTFLQRATTPSVTRNRAGTNGATSASVAIMCTHLDSSAQPCTNVAPLEAASMSSGSMVAPEPSSTPANVFRRRAMLENRSVLRHTRIRVASVATACRKNASAATAAERYSRRSSHAAATMAFSAPVVRTTSWTRHHHTTTPPAWHTKRHEVSAVCPTCHIRGRARHTNTHLVVFVVIHRQQRQDGGLLHGWPGTTTRNVTFVTSVGRGVATKRKWSPRCRSHP